METMLMLSNMLKTVLMLLHKGQAMLGLPYMLETMLMLPYTQLAFFRGTGDAVLTGYEAGDTVLAVD